MKKSGYKDWKIDPESPKSYRCIDRTPTGLAKDLSLPPNTIRNRLKAIGIDDMAVPFKGRLESQPRIFHYEGLPILSAYLKRNGLERFTLNTRNNLPSFMSQLEENLEEYPAKSFCRKLLYTKEEYQRYLFETHVQGQIIERLHYIEQLSRVMVLQPNYSEDTKIPRPYILTPIIGKLNQLILELANYADLTKTDESDLQVSKDDTEKNMEPLGPVDKLVKDWYKDLLERREQLYVDGIVNLSGLQNTDKECLATALNQRLLNETLSRGEKTQIQQMENILKSVENQPSYTFPMSKGSKENLRCAIQELMDTNKKCFLKSVFSVSYIHDFEWLEKHNELSPLYDMIREWFFETIFITSRLQQLISIILVWLKANPNIIKNASQGRFIINGRFLESYNDDKSDNTLKGIVNEAQEVIKNFWEAMHESNYIPMNEDAFKYNVAIDLISEVYQLKSDKESLVAFLSNPIEQKDVCPCIVLDGCIVTMGYFWQKHVETYSRYYANLYEQYLEVFNKIDKTKA